jgi:hypothetical protein
MNNIEEKDKICFYCKLEANYWNFVDGKLINVCLKHVLIEAS